MQDGEERRRGMVEVQIAGRGVRNARVLDAMRAVPRERFVAPDMAEFAYEDQPLPIGEGQTISQPLIVAYMLEAAEIVSGATVLEVGAGSGYAAAVLAEMGAKVFAIERHATLADAARQRLAELGCPTVEVKQGDGTAGWPDRAPFDAIIVSAGGPAVPETLKRQLRLGGRLVIPVGEPGRQCLLKVTRIGKDGYDEEDLGSVAFVPLIGAEGWAEDGGLRVGPDQAKAD